MFTWYAALKVVHILAVVAWIGGAAALTTVMTRLAQVRDRATLAGLVPQTMKYSHTTGATSSLLVLITGIAMVAIGRIGFGTFWVGLGFAGILLHFVYGIVIMRKRAAALAAAVSATPSDDARIAAAGRAVRVGGLIYLLIMTAVIVVMVVKPTL
jgi:uncharacterized membrane protein